ncbi:hypothetical protein FOCG_18081 [Fusarium oxysporum f. sp. radicis-lycopersici 26381]|nr:hypothetical protein FOWG_16949 [Fusarium oxysporum f. sp. lycopersici MN25]EXL39310.1 hypothetical protein FOCG_18081 [Fusarium oxysporum f. sp. radicis-lycopersici 26381]
MEFSAEHASWFGLDVPMDKQLAILNAQSACLHLRKHLDKSRSALKTMTKRQISGRPQIERFSNNVQKLVAESEESQVFAPLLDEDASDPKDWMHRLFIALYTLTKEDFRRIEEHGLTNIFPALLRSIESCTVPKDVESEFIKIIEEACNNEANKFTNKNLLLNLLEAMKKRHPSNRPFTLSPEAFHAFLDPNKRPDQSSRGVPTQLVNARVDHLKDILGPSAMFQAVTLSQQWLFERWQENVSPAGEMRTDAIVAMIPKDKTQDISFLLRVGYRAGWEIVQHLDLLRSSQEPMT